MDDAISRLLTVDTSNQRDTVDVGSRNPAERRSAKRVEVRILSRLAYGNFCFQTVSIENLSFSGFKAKCSLKLQKSDRVSLDLPKIGLVRGTVAWAEGGFVGGAFDKAVDIRKSLRAE